MRYPGDQCSMASRICACQLYFAVVIAMQTQCLQLCKLDHHSSLWSCYRWFASSVFLLSLSMSPVFQYNIPLPTVSFSFIRAKRKPSWFRYWSKYLSKLLNLNSANFSLPLPFIFMTSYFLEGFTSPSSPHFMLLQFLETFCLLFVSCSNSSLFIIYSLTSHPDVVTITGQFDRICNYLGDRHLAMHEGLYLG